MAAVDSKLPRDYKPTGTTWNNRAGAPVHLVTAPGRPSRTTWFCTGCRNEATSTQADAQAQEHAYRCSAAQV